jgi:hypothetical protein
MHGRGAFCLRLRSHEIAGHGYRSRKTELEGVSQFDGGISSVDDVVPGFAGLVVVSEARSSQPVRRTGQRIDQLGSLRPHLVKRGPLLTNIGQTDISASFCNPCNAACSLAFDRVADGRIEVRKSHASRKPSRNRSHLDAHGSGEPYAGKRFQLLASWNRVLRDRWIVECRPYPRPELLQCCARESNPSRRSRSVASINSFCGNWPPL